jgi:hypothetical protein
VGALVRFRLNLATSVRFTLSRARPGRRVGRACKPVSRRNRHGRRCTRYVAVPGSFSERGLAGLNSFHFHGRIRGRKLSLGSYRLLAAPTSNARNGAQAKGFKIVR